MCLFIVWYPLQFSKLCNVRSWYWNSLINSLFSFGEEFCICAFCCSYSQSLQFRISHSTRINFSDQMGTGNNLAMCYHIHFLCYGGINVFALSKLTEVLMGITKMAMNVYIQCHPVTINIIVHTTPATIKNDIPIASADDINPHQHG